MGDRAVGSLDHPGYLTKLLSHLDAISLLCKKTGLTHNRNKKNTRHTATANTQATKFHGNLTSTPFINFFAAIEEDRAQCAAKSSYGSTTALQ